MTAQPRPPPSGDDRADRVAHLQMAQGVISRMGQNAFNAKTWSVTVAAAVFALSPDGKHPCASTWLVLVPLGAFWWLDAYYLRQERLFRALYDAVVAGTAPLFDMRADRYAHREMSLMRVAISTGVWPVHALTAAAVAAKAALTCWG